MPDKSAPTAGGSELLLYRAEDGKTHIQVRLEDETVWLTQQMMADLFQTTKQNISLHVQKVLAERELAAVSTVKQYLTVQREGSREVKRCLDFYNLDMVISVGYRVRSHVATRFRIWATQRLREYIVKGFTLDDERLKQTSGGNYFDELLARIRDIRSSEKLFWRKVLDIYALSADYDPNTDLSQKFFAVVQNKMHWAAHGHTAAEIVAARADASQPNMGLTTWTGNKPSRTDAEIAKNYLAAPELDALNRIVSLYLDFAEFQTMSRRVMYMRDWITKLDDFLHLSERDILTHAGTVSHDDAVAKARREFKRFHVVQINGPSPVEQDFQKAVAEVKKIKNKKGTG
ncbi:MAG: virulence RhuM family protein [Candidatus Methylomirabilia bacterium]